MISNINLKDKVVFHGVSIDMGQDMGQLNANEMAQEASVGSPISSTDHIEAILEGLPQEYDGFIVSMTSRKDPYTITDIESLLVAQEERIESHKKDTDLTPTLSANLAQL